jgi:glycerol-3-phosphate dehydrogenase (NAD(P)+)
MGNSDQQPVRAISFQRVGVEMPITEQIYQVLYQGKDAKLAALDLLGREKRDEVT